MVLLGVVQARGGGLPDFMGWMSRRPTSWLVGVASGAGAVGVILALAGVHSALRTVLVLLFVVVAPTAAIAGLLRGLDSFSRVLLAGVSTVALLIIVAMILLSAGLWSPLGELFAVAMITAGCLLAQRPGARARVASWVVPRWQALLRCLRPASQPGAAPRQTPEAPPDPEARPAPEPVRGTAADPPRGN
jgi:hypothetical protein